ncbi:GNAT family N-acetyltransferase (plasmid) [Tistrella mobilis]|uniref:GNAT family N-acetyltransferase n=1 Tax=Tistrella mobilis TaxID=171437 RepID=UPI003558C973
MTALTRVDTATFPVFTAFLMAHSDAGTRDYLSHTDLKALFLERQGAEAWFYGDGARPQAVISLVRSPRHDGCIVIPVQILTGDGRVPTADACLDAFLDHEAAPVPLPRLYRIGEQTHQPVPADRLAARGFARIAGLCEYQRPAGPPVPGEFALADQALAAGYTLALFDDPAGLPDPSVLDRVATIHNRTLGARGAAADWTADVVRGRLSRPGSGLIIARRQAEVAGHILFQQGDDGILVIEACLARPHWRSGAVDAMCRLMAAEVSAPRGEKVVACADATNAASRRAMERAGMTLSAERHLWEKKVGAGEHLLPAPTPAVLMPEAAQRPHIQL